MLKQVGNLEEEDETPRSEGASMQLGKLACLLSCVRLFVAPWTIDNHAPLTMGFSRQEYWSGLLFPPPGDLPDPGIEPASLALQADSLSLSHQGSHYR